MIKEITLEFVSKGELNASLKNYDNTYLNVVDYGFVLPEFK